MGKASAIATPARKPRADVETWTQNQPTNNESRAKYDTLGEPETILVGKQGFIEIAHRRATFSDGSQRDFVLIARGYVDRPGRKCTERLVTIPAEFAGAVAAVLAAPERSLASIARELEARREG
jgi:hypothetical protein